MLCAPKILKERFSHQRFVQTYVFHNFTIRAISKHITENLRKNNTKYFWTHFLFFKEESRFNFRVLYVHNRNKTFNLE